MVVGASCVRLWIDFFCCVSSKNPEKQPQDFAIHNTRSSLRQATVIKFTHYCLLIMFDILTHSVSLLLTTPSPTKSVYEELGQYPTQATLSSHVYSTSARQINPPHSVGPAPIYGAFQKHSTDCISSLSQGRDFIWNHYQWGIDVFLSNRAVQYTAAL